MRTPKLAARVRFVNTRVPPFPDAAIDNTKSFGEAPDSHRFPSQMGRKRPVPTRGPADAAMANCMWGTPTRTESGTGYFTCPRSRASLYSSSSSWAFSCWIRMFRRRIQFHIQMAQLVGVMEAKNLTHSPYP